MTEHLTKSLIDLRGFGLTSQRVTKLRLDHMKGRFDVAALVIALHEPFRVVVEEVVHLFPNSRTSRPTVDTAAVRLERI